MVNIPQPDDSHDHRSANPFDHNKPTIAQYSAQEIATLQHRLDKQLGPEYISTRPGAGGGKVHYLAAEKVINLANEVFGFNGWSSSIQNAQIDFVDEHPQNGKITLGLSTIVRVTIRDGTFHEDIGYGHIENCKGKAAAFEKAKKEAATDALKRALRNFGNVLGNCLYDKNYLQRVTKIKVAPSKWDPGNLHRHRDYAPVEEESTTEAENRAMTASQASKASSADYFGDSTLNLADFTYLEQENAVQGGVQQQEDDEQQASQEQTVDGQLVDESGLPLPRSPPPGNPEGFVTGRSVNLLNQPPEIRPSNVALAFNPHAESPSIRRTVGVNPGKSAPVSRQSLGGKAHLSPAPQPPPQPPPAETAHGTEGVGPGVNGTGTTTPVRTADFVNPAADLNRRIGAPGGTVGGMNRGPYRPPTAVGGVKRPTLADKSNNNIAQTDGSGGGDGKKPKMSPTTEAP